jgi:hypothetical protein
LQSLFRDGGYPVAAESEVSLSQLAAKLNAFLYRSTGTNNYATFFYAQIETAIRLAFPLAVSLRPPTKHELHPVGV